MSVTACFGERLDLGGPQPRRTLEDRTSDVDDIARQTLEQGLRSGRVGCKPRCKRRPFGNFGRIDEPQRQLGVVVFVFRRVDRPLQVEIGQHSQQGGVHVDAVAVGGEIEQALKTSKCRESLHYDHCAFAATLPI